MSHIRLSHLNLYTGYVHKLFGRLKKLNKKRGGGGVKEKNKKQSIKAVHVHVRRKDRPGSYGS